MSHLFRRISVPGAVVTCAIAVIIAIIYYSCKYWKRWRSDTRRPPPVGYWLENSLLSQSAGIPSSPAESSPYPMGPYQYPPGVQCWPESNTYPTGAPIYPTQPQGTVGGTQYPQGNSFNQTYKSDCTNTVPMVESNQVSPRTDNNIAYPAGTNNTPSNQFSTKPYPSNVTGNVHPELSSNPLCIAAEHPLSIQEAHPPGISASQNASAANQTIGTNAYPIPYSTIPWPMNGSEDKRPSGSAISSSINFGGVQEIQFPQGNVSAPTVPMSNISPERIRVIKNETSPTSYPSPYSTIPLPSSGSETHPLSSISSAQSEATSLIPVRTKISPTEAFSHNY